jgi:nitroreductase
MKDKIKKILKKPNGILTKKEFEELSLEEELKVLRKENKELRKSLQEQAIEKFKDRRSIRKYSNKKVDFKTIHSIIEAGLNAPCAGNVQNCKVIVVENYEKRLECGKVALQQYWIADAPVILVVVRDDSEVVNLYPEYGKTYSVQNSAALIENILMATHFYDLGACWVECGDNDVLKQMFKVPVEMKIDAMIPIGYPLEKPQVDKCSTSAMIYFEEWKEFSR